jgi:hypothetical protein
MSSNPNYLDLDLVKPDVDFVFKYKGKEHSLKQATVADFIQNTKKLQKMDIKPGDVEAEYDALIEMICRSFPTFTPDDAKTMTLSQLNALLERAFALNGQAEMEKNVQVEKKEGNAEAGAASSQSTSDTSSPA